MSPSRGPGLARLLLHLLLPADRREYVIGDMEELYQLRRSRRGSLVAHLHYWRDAIVSMGSGRGAGAVRGPASGSPLPPAGDGRVRETLRDLGAALRSMLRRPAFFLLAALTLALGIGSTTAIFGMVNQLVLRPLPGTADDGRGAYLSFRAIDEPESTRDLGLSLPDVRQLREEATLLDGFATWGTLSVNVSVGDARPVVVSGSSVFGDFFEALGVRPRAGRLIAAAETEFDAGEPVVVITPELASQLFGSASAVGRTIRVNGTPIPVVGVVGDGFRGPTRDDAYDMWFPLPTMVALGFARDRFENRNTVSHADFVVRLAPGVDAASAEAQLDAILDRIEAGGTVSAERVARLQPELFAGLNVSPQWRERTHETLRLLAGVVLLVLLIACANVANLLLFRNVAQRGQTATRRALGASAGRIAREKLAESVILGLTGALGGLVVAWLLTLPFQGESLLRMPAFDAFSLDARVLTFAVAAAMGTAVLFGTLPALFAGRFDLGAAMRDGARRETGRMGVVRWAMATGQVALSLTLVVGALLLGRTLQKLYASDTGFDVTDMVTMNFGMNGWPTGEEGEVLTREVMAELSRLPGVTGVARDMYGPNGGRMLASVGLPEAANDALLSATEWPVSANWFELFDVEFTAGRTFLPAEEEAAALGHVVVTPSLARKLFGTEDAVGRRIQIGGRSPVEVEIVGVTERISSARSPDVAEDVFFVPARFAPLPFFLLAIETREFGPAQARRIREVVETLLPAQPVADPVPLTERVDRIHSERRVLGELLGILALMAAALTAVGLYGVIAFTVSGRTREFGIRIALGAGTDRIAGLVLRHTVGIVAVGFLAGAFGAWVLSSVLESRLFGVGRVDPVSYGLALVGFGVIAALATWVPARAATRVDPVEALGAE